MERESPQEVTRLFTTADAGALIAPLQLSFAAIAEIRRQIEALLGSLAEESPASAVEVLRGDAPPPPGREADLGRVQELISELARAVEGIVAQGVLVKDLEPGEVDFPSVIEGRFALLCWQYGEVAIGHFHLAEEGLEDRRLLPGAPLVLQ